MLFPSRVAPEMESKAAAETSLRETLLFQVSVQVPLPMPVT